MKLTLIVIRSLNIKKAVIFYKMLGFDFLYHRHGEGSLHYSTTINDTVFEIYPLLKPQKKPDISTRLGFRVKNLDMVISNLKLTGFEIVKEASESEWGYRAIVKDFDGRKIELSQEDAY